MVSAKKSHRVSDLRLKWFTMLASITLKTFLAVFVLLGAIIGIMAVGVMMGKSPLKGSCGGKGGPECDLWTQGRPTGS